jgi:hypothetical protein
MASRYVTSRPSEPTLDSVYRSSPMDVVLYVGVIVVCILAFWPQ